MTLLVRKPELPPDAAALSQTSVEDRGNRQDFVAVFHEVRSTGNKPYPRSNISNSKFKNLGGVGCQIRF